MTNSPYPFQQRAYSDMSDDELRQIAAEPPGGAVWNAPYARDELQRRLNPGMVIPPRRFLV